MKKLLATTAMVILMTGSLAMADSGMGKHRFEEQLSKFSPATQELIKSSWKDGKEERKASFEQIKSLHKELDAIIAAETFDKAAFAAKHQQINALKDKMDASRTERMAELFAQLSQKDRETFVSMKKEMREKWHYRGGKDETAAEPAE